MCVFREELGKGINTDEAAALGAVYQAAHLGKGFKVKKFAIKDATLYPIKVRSLLFHISVVDAVVELCFLRSCEQLLLLCSNCCCIKCL